MGRNWFSNIVVDGWNRLGNHVVSTESLARFKRTFYQFMGEHDRWKWVDIFHAGITTCSPDRFAQFAFLLYVLLCSYVLWPTTPSYTTHAAHSPLTNTMYTTLTPSVMGHTFTASFECE